VTDSAPLLLDGLLLPPLISHVVDESLARREPGDDTGLRPLGRDLLQHIPGRRPGGSFASLGRGSDQGGKEGRGMVIELYPRVRPRTDDVPDGHQEMGERGGGIRLAIRIDRLHDAPSQADVGFPRHRRPEASVREPLHVGGRPAGLRVIVEAGSHAVTGSNTTRTWAPVASSASAKSAAPASTAGLVATS